MPLKPLNTMGFSPCGPLSIPVGLCAAFAGSPYQEDIIFAVFNSRDRAAAELWNDHHIEALQAADNGLTRKQIRDLFHGHLGSGPIDQALKKLRPLGLATFRHIPGRGPFTTLWAPPPNTKTRTGRRRQRGARRIPLEET